MKVEKEKLKQMKNEIYAHKQMNPKNADGKSKIIRDLYLLRFRYLSISIKRRRFTNLTKNAR